MKRIFLTFIIFLFFASFANSQSDQRSKASIVKDKVVSYQMGHVQTIQGEYTVIFDDTLSVDYTIMLTPFSGNTSLYVAKKTQEKVMIKTKDGSDMEFDYIIFIKRNGPIQLDKKE